MGSAQSDIEALLECGQLDAALAAAESRYRDLPEGDRRHSMAAIELHFCQGEVARGHGDWDEAFSAYSKAMEVFEELQSDFVAGSDTTDEVKASVWVARTSRAFSALHRDAGDPDGAEPYAARAVEYFEAFGGQRELEGARRELEELLRERADRSAFPIGGSRRWSEYFDCSSDPGAADESTIDAVVLEAITRGPFEELGYSYTLITSPYDGARRTGCFERVWRSSDRKTNLLASDAAFRFATLFVDGSIVVTAERPPFWAWIRAAPGMRQHPKDHFYHEFVDGPMDEVYERHLERVEELLASSGGEVVPVDDMRAYFATRLRFLDLMTLHLRLQWAIGWTLPVLVAIGVTIGAARWFASPLLLAFIATLSFVACFQPLYWLAAPTLARLLPAAPGYPARALLARAALVPRCWVTIRRDPS